MKHETIYRTVKVSETFPKRDGYYAVKYLYMPCIIDIQKDEIKSLTLPEGKVITEFELEDIEWLEPLSNVHVFTEDELKGVLVEFANFDNSIDVFLEKIKYKK